MGTCQTKIKLKAWTDYAPEILAAVLKTIPERNREICLKYSEGYSMRELGIMYDISECRIRQIIHTALGKANRVMKKVYVMCKAIRAELE